MTLNDPFAAVIKNARLEIVQYGFVDCADEDQPVRILDCYSISYMRSGSSVLRIYGQEYLASEGDIFIIPPNVQNEHIMCQDGGNPSFMWWNFTYKLYGMIEVLDLLELPILFHITNIEPLESTFQRYLTYLEHQSKISDYIFMEAKALEMVAILLDMVPSFEKENVTQAHGTFLSILVEIMRNPEQQRLLPMLAEKYSMHPTYISNHFKKLYKVTPTQFQREIKLQRAKSLLLGDRSRTIGEISYTLGYEHQSDFTRFFKSNCDMSPQQYRDANTSITRSDSVQ